MKFNPLKILWALWPALWLPTVMCQAQDKSACEVTVAAGTMPDGSSILLHVRTAEAATSPLQISTRYFSERVKLPGNVIELFKDPVAAKDVSPAPVPVLTLQVPAETKLAYAVLWTETDENNQPAWKGCVFGAKDWDNNSLKVLNASSEQISIHAGTKEILLPRGKSADFPSRDWSEPFPVKLFQLKPEQKCIFSSTWRVTSGRRELCFIYNTNNSVSLHSILEIPPTKRKTKP